MPSAIIASALRIYYTHAFLSIGPGSSESWITYVASSNSLWLIIEANISIVAACLPTLGGFFKSRLSSSKNTATSPYAKGDTTRMLAQPGRNNVLVSGERRNTWVPLRDPSTETRVMHDDDYGKPDREELRTMKGILVKKTFANDSEAWA